MDQDCIVSGAPAGPVVQVCFPSVRAAVLDSLNRQREEGRLCDLSIQVQGQVFRAHRCVLAASSPYFHDQVLLKNVTTVSLPSVMDPVAFESVLSSAYTGRLSIVRDDIVNYVTVASFLQMWHIVDKCTEILKRPRPPTECNPVDVPAATRHGASSRQQSPSSTDCLYMEREGKEKEKRTYGQVQNALPPLATWRRPHQFPRWGHPRSSPQPALSMPVQHLADSQLDSHPAGESDYSSCEELWMSSHSKASLLSHHDGRGLDHSHTRHGGFPGEALRLRARLRQRAAPPSAEKLHGRDRGSGEGYGEDPQEKKGTERVIEASEGMGEELEEEKREGPELRGHSVDFHSSVHQGEEGGQPEGRKSSGELQKKEERQLGRSSALTSPRAGEPDEVIPGTSCSASTPSTQKQWQASPWSQQVARPQAGEEDYRREDDEDDDVGEGDFGRFADGAFGRETYDEIEDGTGQVSQRPLVPTSPDDKDFILGAPELNWPNGANMTHGGGTPTSTSSCHLSPSPAPFPPSSSPPIPSSSSSISLAGAPYTGKVHFCHCGKAYTLKSMRDRHVKMQHLNLRPFACPVCAKSFKMKHHLTKHLKTHGGLRPYECGLCGKKVIWRDSFLRHQARCERLAASYDGAAASSNTTAAAEMDDGYAYGFKEGEVFFSQGGQVKVEQADCQGEAESGMSALLAGGVGAELGSQSRTVVSHSFKEEASNRFS
ncbi:zinc finger and BTB domain-containing protein 22-like isoform X1 [Salvelinus namaycush]|uniref:Zinc finger and BTB domain-containing protein 22-like isoform X1 n=1 Tax=Salvelinus namaycush TaxID=8040 RepID=A0A8U0TNV5_SALNM|nr:zinc finger and BTB domain-containing protein 22-like isoform X1 [Salvelinus namaycush]